MKTWMKLALGLGAAATVVAWILIDGAEREARLTAKGTAVVTAVELKRDAESRSLDETEYALRLGVDGRQIATTATHPGDRSEEFTPGHRFTVCYNPADPAEADIELDPAARCGT